MPNQPIAELIARSLGQGLTHPGDGKTGPVVVPLAGYRTTGMPQEMAEMMDASAKLIGEAVVHTIENDGNSTIITNPELDQLRTQAAANPNTGARPVTFTCKLCHNKLFTAAIRPDDPQLNATQLADVNLVCPHGPTGQPA